MAPHRTVTELAQLADRLIIRHLRISVPDKGARGELQRGRVRENLLEQDVRCVALVGASASAAVHERGDALATELEERFLSEKEEYEKEKLRLQRVYRLDPNDFETRLAALSRTPGATQQVRDAIADQYGYRHPTILGYELLAHLLKHRFLDAIISFNFDELLDQSLDDELGPNEYRRLVSDRDCVNVVSDPDATDYLPLYIKLHGTATEPDSLRFTREAYYKLPQYLMLEVERLFRSQHCVIVNVGSGMSGFDLHRLLRIPKQLEIYDLSPKPLSPNVQEEIASERTTPLKDSLSRGAKRDAPRFELAMNWLPAGARTVTCDTWLKRLVDAIEHQSGNNTAKDRLASLVRFRSVNRHEAVADILGVKETLSRWTRDSEEHRREYIDYLRQRTIIELAFSGAKARGLGQLSWFAVDRCGTYYDLYRREARKEAGIKTLSWKELRAAAGLAENEALPDVVESDPDLCDSDAGPTLCEGKWALREFVPEVLAEHVANEIGKGDKVKRLANALKEHQAGSEVEIQPTEDHVCAKAFDRPLTLPTLTSLAVFTARLFNGIQPHDEVYISCETGEWLVRDKQMYDLLCRQNHVEVITAFAFKNDALTEKYNGRLKLHAIDPWRHNRHMTIVCSGNVPSRAVYFARRLRTPLITPVYLGDSEDAKRLKRAFDLMLYEIPKSG